MPIQEYKNHIIEVKSCLVGHAVFGDKKQPTEYSYEINGELFDIGYKNNEFYARDNPGTSHYEIHLKSVEEAFTLAKKAIDKRYEIEEKRAEYRRNLIIKDYEAFMKYLASKEVPQENIPIIASNLTLASTQKELFSNKYKLEINGDVDASVSGSIET